MKNAGEITVDFSRIGHRLVTEALVGANFGNISIRSGDGFYITRQGSYLAIPGEPVYVPLEGSAPLQASSEHRVHRQIYINTPYHAVVHAHPPHAVALSLAEDAISPVDSEGLLLCPFIPVVTGFPGSEELAQSVSHELLSSPVAIARGHGTFAGGKDLDEAYIRTSLAEHSCRILILLKQIIPF